MKLKGYTVKKEPVYLLKHIDFSNQDSTRDCYMYRDENNGEIWHRYFFKNDNLQKYTKCYFTQAEIDKLHTGSYEQIEVNFDEVEE